jgi:hypothetical protein
VATKVYAAQNAIKAFYNTLDGKTGMERIMAFFCTESRKAGTTFAQTPYDPSIPKLQLSYNDTRSLHAMACLIGLRSIEALLAHSQGNSTSASFARMSETTTGVF